MQNLAKKVTGNGSYLLSSPVDNDYQISNTNLLIFNELISRKFEESTLPVEQFCPALSDASMQKLARLAINNEGFIFNPNSGDSYQVSESGLLIITEFKCGKSEEEIAMLFANRYEVTGEEALRDVVDFRATLKKLGLI